MHELREYINIKRSNKEHIWLGDVNLPDIDWDILNPKPGGNASGLSQILLGMSNDFGLEQIVREPSRINNTLELFLTINPTLVDRSTIVPGISDHDESHNHNQLQTQSHQAKTTQHIHVR